MVSAASWPALRVDFVLISRLASGRLFFPYLAAQLLQSTQLYWNKDALD